MAAKDNYCLIMQQITQHLLQLGLMWHTYKKLYYKYFPIIIAKYVHSLDHIFNTTVTYLSTLPLMRNDYSKFCLVPSIKWQLYNQFN